MAQTLTPLPGAYAVCRLPPDAPLPPQPPRVGGLWSATRTAQELSVVCRAPDAPDDALIDVPWCALRLVGPFDLQAETGILSSVVGPLGEAQISAFALATYDTDYVLVPAMRAGNARAALTRAGHEVTRAPVTLRAAVVQDAPGIAALAWEGFLGYREFAPADMDPSNLPADPYDIAQRIDAPGSRTFVAETADGTIAGVVAMIATDEPDLGHVWELVVDGGHRGTGLARVLLDWLFEAARSDGLARVRLYAARDGAQVQRFYARQGFDPMPDGDAISPSGLPVVLLSRPL